MKLKFDLQLDDGVFFRALIAVVVLLVELLPGFLQVAFATKRNGGRSTCFRYVARLAFRRVVIFLLWLVICGDLANGYSLLQGNARVTI